MEELLALIAGVDDEEDLLIRVAKAKWSEGSLELWIDVSVIDGSEPSVWVIHCEKVLAHKLSNSGVSDLQLLADHPVLWPFKTPIASAFFFGTTSNVAACVGALYEAHIEKTASWIQFEEGFHHSMPLSKLLGAGNGLLARGPVLLLRKYQEVLKPFGIEVSIVNEGPYQFWDGSSYRSLEGEIISALIFGESYVAGIGWSAKQI